MSTVAPLQDILANHVNDGLVVYDPLRPDRLYAEELDAIRGRLVSGQYTVGTWSLNTGGAERLTENGDAKLRAMYAAGTVGGEIPSGAGSRLLYYPGTQAIRGGTINNADWDAANLGNETIGFGRDISLVGAGSVGYGRFLSDKGFAGAVLLGAGVSLADQLGATAADQILMGIGSDVPTIRVTAASGVGTVGLVGLGLGATAPSAVVDIGASTTARASLRLRAGTAPAAPNEGDLWLTVGGSLQGRVNGSTVTLAGVGLAGPSFPGLTGGTNTTAAMVVGTGASLGRSGSGTISASDLLGATWAAPAAIGSTTPAAGSFTRLILSQGANVARRATGTSPVTVTTADCVISCTAVPMTVNLPAAATAGAGFVLVVKDASGAANGGNRITLDGSGAETIDGSLTRQITSAYGSYTIVSNGVSNWEIV